VTAHRLLSPRWLATGGAAVLAAVLGVVLVVDHNAAACAAPPSTTAHKGKATFYDLEGTQGNCSFQPPADDLYVALGRTEYSGALSCGSYLDVTGPKGKVRVKVFDSCPECTTGWLDLSRTAFKKIGAEVAGVIPITYKAVPNAATPGPLSITFAKGSSQYWWAVLIDNHANPIKSVSAKGPGGSWMMASHADYNIWIIDHQTGTGPFSIKMTDIYGHTATAKNIKLQPGKKQTSSVRLTTGPAAEARTEATTAPTTAPTVAPTAKSSRTPAKSPGPTASAATSTSPAAEAAVVAPVALAAAPAKSCR
jgi:expansin (peptidoglycan-binding protein)